MNFSKIGAVLLLASSVSSAQEPKKSTLSIPVEKGGEFIPPKAILVEETSKVTAGENGSLKVQSEIGARVREIQASAPTSAPTTVPLDAIMHVPFGRPVVGRPGFVNSPFANDNQLVDVSGLPVGMEVKCPYSGKLFRVPAVDPKSKDVVDLLQSELTLPKLKEYQGNLISQLSRTNDQGTILEILEALRGVTEKILGLEGEENNKKPKQ